MSSRGKFNPSMASCSALLSADRRCSTRHAVANRKALCSYAVCGSPGPAAGKRRPSCGAIAAASHGYITKAGPWEGATEADADALAFEMGRQSPLAHARAVAEARAALGGASAYEPSLRSYYAEIPGVDLYRHADDIIDEIRRALAQRA